MYSEQYQNDILDLRIKLREQAHFKLKNGFLKHQSIQTQSEINSKEKFNIVSDNINQEYNISSNKNEKKEKRESSAMTTGNTNNK